MLLCPLYTIGVARSPGVTIYQAAYVTIPVDEAVQDAKAHTSLVCDFVCKMWLFCCTKLIVKHLY